MKLDHVGVFRISALAAVGLALFVLTYVGAATPSAEPKRLGLRGLKRQRALESIPLWPVIEPAVRWMGARVSGLVRSETREKLNQRISLAGDYLGLLPEEVVGLSILTALTGIVLGSMLGWLSGMGDMIVTAGFLFGAALPYMKISSAAADRLKEVNRRLPYAIDLLSLAMGAGLDFPGSVRQVVEKSGSPNDPVVEEFTLILQALQLGRTRRMALEAFAERCPADSVVEFVGAMIQADLRGNPIAEALRIQAEVARRKRTVNAEEAAARAGVAMMGPLVLVFLCILLLIVAPIVMRIQQAD
jgi:tight adherence protein C